MQRKIIVFCLLMMVITIALRGADSSVFGDKFLYEEEQYAYGKKYWSEGKAKESIEAFLQMIRDYPKTKYREESYFLIGYIYNNSLQDTANAAIYYRQLIKNHPKSEFTPSAIYELDHLGTPEFMPEFETETNK